eukprot:XP_025007984.1 uncharacterized protein LOC101748083 [Gallus gallus]
MGLRENLAPYSSLDNFLHSLAADNCPCPLEKIKKTSGTGTGQVDPASLGTEETDNINALDLLCQMDAYITLMERLMTILMQHHVKNDRGHEEQPGPSCGAACGGDQEPDLQPHSWFGLTSFPTTIEDRKDNQALPEEQPVEETKSQTSTWRCWFGLTSCPIGTKDTKTNQVLPEEQRTEKTKSQTSYWSCLLGSSQCPPWVWYKGSKVAVPQGPKQQAPGTKQKAYSLPGILGHLWDYLMQRGSTWLLTAPSTIFSILWLLTTARAHWRRLRRPRGQGTGQVDPASLEQRKRTT